MTEIFQARLNVLGIVQAQFLDGNAQVDHQQQQATAFRFVAMEFERYQKDAMMPILLIQMAAQQLVR